MSQFREAFTKESGENVLEYDDNAFLFFANTLLLVLLVPWSYSLIRELLSSKSQGKGGYHPKKTNKGAKYQYCECPKSLDQFAEIRKADESWRSRITMSFIVQLLIVVLLWLLFLFLFSSLDRVKSIISFDPYEILGVKSSATVPEIKKAYRLLALKYHPDQNPNDPAAAAKFMLLSKALRSLTDETSRRNFLEYGNPDGPVLLKVSVALPRILVQEKYQVLILSCFFFFFFVFIPGIFICYYQRQKKYAPNGVMIGTLRNLYFNLGADTRCRDLPRLLASSAECCSIPLKQSDNYDMEKIIPLLENANKKMFHAPVVVRNYLLILAHMQRLHDNFSPPLLTDLTKILSVSVLITRSMLDAAIAHDWLQTVKSVIEFRQCLVQALDVDSSSLLQIPHVTKQTLKHMTRGKKRAVTTLAEYIAQPAEERKGLVGMPVDHIADIEAYCKHVPKIELEARIFVEDEKEIAFGDFATCEIVLRRLNLQEDEAAGPVFAPYFPTSKFEEWWIFVSDKQQGRIMGFVCCNKHERTCIERISFEVNKIGKQVLEIAAICDSYMGLDQTMSLEVYVHSPANIMREMYVHSEDAELDEEKTLLEQVMRGTTSSNSSECGEELNVPTRYAKDLTESDENDKENG